MKKLIFSTLLCALAMGCASNPIKAGCGSSKGQTLETCAYAVYGTLVITEQQAARLITDPAVPPAAKVAIQAADRAASPVLEAGVSVVEQFKQAAAAADPGALATATANLQEWVTRAQAQNGALLTATHEAKP